MNKPLFLRHNYLYVFGLLVLVTGLPLSLFLISISQFILLGSFFLEGNPMDKFRKFYQNKSALLISGIWLMHVIGMLWTTDLAQGWNDIRIKLPLLILTVIMAGSEPLQKKQFNLVLAIFIAAVFAGTMVSMAVLTGVIHREIVDIRDIFIFKISHIRFGLFTCIAIFSLLYFIFYDKGKRKLTVRFGLGLLAIWLLAFLFIVESLTGLSICISILFLQLIYHIWNWQRGIGKVILISMSIVIPAIFLFYLQKKYKAHYSPRQVSIDVNAKTLNGNSYTFDFEDTEVENGFPSYIYMCDEELRSSWNRRSKMKFDSLDMKMQPLKFTLIRFLASKGLRKDSAAVSHLTESEIHSVEKGITNVDHQSPSVIVRLMLVKWEIDEYARGGDPNGHSIMQRLESWKAAVGVISSNIFFGVGTGDLPETVHEQYAIMNSKLDKDHYLRAHNQYLAIAVAFGITGLIYFSIAVFYPVLFAGRRLNYLYLTFFLTLLFSMLTEDTLETQPGATFYAFFNALLLYGFPKESADNPITPSDN